MSIPRKLKPCIDCNVPSYIFSHGRCRHCSQLTKLAEKKQTETIRWQHNESMELGNVNAGDEITISSGKKYVTYTIKRKPVKKSGDEYKDFFESLVIPERCEECNERLLAFNNFGRRCVSAPILPKQTFKSVAKHPDNILFMGAGLLGACNHHDVWDRGIENRKSMRVYKIALERLESFKHLLTDKELVMAEKYLGIDDKK